MNIRFGVIRSFDRDLYAAAVELLGYAGTLLVDVPVAFSVREDLIVDGAQCVVLLADEFDARTAVVVALYGGRPADDPRFDPLVGHRHRGLLGDGPKLE
ncbi:MAG: hypothetical protein ACPLRM_00270 [Anaerolineae bacterium]